MIVKKLIGTNFWFDRHGGRSYWSRVIPGLNIKVPWPKKEPVEKVDYPIDTPRLDVETKTFVPMLLSPPMPRSVIDELRNKYSVFRTRHEPEYIAQKKAEDAEKEAKKKQIEEMRTPLKEINRKLRKLRKQKGKGKLTEDMLEKIGQIIANGKQKKLDAVGLAKIGQLPEAITA